MKPDMRNIDDVVNRYLPSASKEDVESGGARVLQRLESNPAIESSPLAVPTRSWWQPTPMRAAVAAGFVMAALVSVWALVLPEKAYAIVHSVSGSLLRVEGGKTQPVSVGERIDVGTPLRTESGAGAVLKLPDGASIEMHEKSDIQLEPTKDGMSIRLNDGSVHVTPAKQPAGNLYVQTKDGTVPVVAALFQSVAEPRAAQNREPREAFEAVSIRLRPGAGGGGGPRGQGGGNGGFGKCDGKTPELDPSRFATSNAGIYYLITYAYGISAAASSNMTARCVEGADLRLLSGGPDWIDSAIFDIQATIPDGPPVFTSRMFSGLAMKEPTPRLQRMLQAMLEERFKLVLRRDMKEMPVYVLSVGKGGSRLTPWKEGDLANGGQTSTFMLYNPRELPYSPQHTYERQRVSFFYGAKASMGWLAGTLSYVTKRLVLDRTGLPGDYNYQLVFAPLQVPAGADTAGVPVMSSPSLFTALEEDLGLELKPATEKVEVFVIDRLERPSEN
jgi:uncharacterized protein (TIGR03435 family)